MADTKLAERLAGIIGMLNNGDTVSVMSLAEKYNTSERTIQRDLLERLSFLSIEKTKTGWKLDPRTGGKLSNKVIKNFAAISGIRELFPTLDDKFLKSIMSLEKQSAYLIKPHNYELLTNQNSKQLFLKLETAITNTEHLNFQYKEKQYKNIKPYKLINSKGIWYLAALDGDRLKSYHFSKIQLAHCTNTFFSRVKSIEEKLISEESIWFGDKKFDVILEINSKVSDYFLRRKLLPKQMIKKENIDGSLTVSSTVSNDNQILPLIKYWMPNIKVISPEYLNKKIRDDIDNFLNL